MKALTLFSKEEVLLRQLLTKLENYGQFNGSPEDFVKLYEQWHLKNFPKIPVSYMIVNSREDWLKEFVKYLSEVDI